MIIPLSRRSKQNSNSNVLSGTVHRDTKLSGKDGFIVVIVVDGFHFAAQMSVKCHTSSESIADVIWINYPDSGNVFQNVPIKYLLHHLQNKPGSNGDIKKKRRER